MDNVVSAKAFNLLDSNGKTRARLACTDDDEPVLSFHDDEGKECLSISSSNDGSDTLRIKNRLTSKTCLRISVHDDGSPNISLADSAGRIRLICSVYNQSPYIRLRNSEGQDGGITIGLNPSGEPIIVGKDADDIKRFTAE